MADKYPSPSSAGKDKPKGTQAGHAVTSKSNSVKPAESYSDSGPMSKEAKAALQQLINNIDAGKKAAAKKSIEESKHPKKDNWITRL